MSAMLLSDGVAIGLLSNERYHFSGKGCRAAVQSLAALIACRQHSRSSQRCNDNDEIEKPSSVSGASRTMLARIRPRRPYRKFLKRRNRFGRNQLTLRWLRSAADRIGQHLQREVGIRTNIDRGRQQTAAHPRLAALRQAIATRE